MSSPTRNDNLPLADVEVHFLGSEQVGHEFKIFIGHCPGRSQEPPTVLYLVDANGMFGGAVEIIRFMQLSNHLPPIVVVGIGYRVGAIDEAMALRARDLTPTTDSAFSGIFPEMPDTGGADRFGGFVRDELKPWVEARFVVDPGEAAYFGHSLGGLFGVYMLLTEPEMFRRYGIGSPSLWWDDDIIFDIEASSARGRTDLPAKVIFVTGEYEDHEGRQREAGRLPDKERSKAGLRKIDMVADSERMVSTLKGRQYPSLEICSQVLPGEFHTTVQHLNLSRSLRFLFDAPE